MRFRKEKQDLGRKNRVQERKTDFRKKNRFQEEKKGFRTKKPKSQEKKTGPSYYYSLLSEVKTDSVKSCKMSEAL